MGSSEGSASSRTKRQSGELCCKHTLAKHTNLMHGDKLTTCALTCRLFEELWVPLVNDSFAKGGTVYMHLTGPMGKHLLHAAQMQPGLEQPPSTSAGKLQLLNALLALINSNKLSGAAMPVASADPAARVQRSQSTAQPEYLDTDQQVLFATRISADPLPYGPGDWQGNVAAAHTIPTAPIAPTVAEWPVSAAGSRPLVFDGANIDRAGVPALTRVYLDGHMGLSPFINYFPVPACIPLPAQFRPEGERHPRWEKDSHRDVWDKRKDLAFEVCRQAYALQQAVNARVPVFEACRQEEHRQSKKKFVAREVSMDLRTAASKVAALLQAAMQTNKKNGCHPQTIATLSKMFKDLRAGKQDADVHRSSSSNKPNPRVPASSLQGWMCIASSSDIDTMLTDLYTQMRSTL